MTTVGDGTATQTAPIAADGALTATHRYAEAGTFHATFTVSNANPTPVTSTLEVLIQAPPTGNVITFNSTSGHSQIQVNQQHGNVIVTSQGAVSKHPPALSRLCIPPAVSSQTP